MSKECVRSQRERKKPAPPLTLTSLSTPRSAVDDGFCCQGSSGDWLALLSRLPSSGCRCHRINLFTNGFPLKTAGPAFCARSVNSAEAGEITPQRFWSLPYRRDDVERDNVPGRCEQWAGRGQDSAEGRGWRMPPDVHPRAPAMLSVTSVSESRHPLTATRQGHRI